MRLIHSAKVGIILLLAPMLALAPTAVFAWGKEKKKEATQEELKLPQRNFLPPLAVINGPLTPEHFQPSEDNAVEPVALTAVTTPAFKVTPKIQKLETELGVQYTTEPLQELKTMQQKLDEADLRQLWEATVERNPVIRFSLEKLSTPVDLQPKKSSQFMKKTLSLMIQGATMGATMMPGVAGGSSYYQNMTAMALGNAAQNMVNGNPQPAGDILTPTEQIQLAGLIDELKVRLVENYHGYKNTLLQLTEAHQLVLKNNALYTEALQSRNALAITAAARTYYQASLNELKLRQQAKIYRIQLERLAGPEPVSDLQLALLVNPEESAQFAAGQAPQLPQELPEQLELTPTLKSQTDATMATVPSGLVGPPPPDLPVADDQVKE